MASTLAIDLASGADSILVLRRVQTILDGAVAPRTDVLALESGGSVTMALPDDVASEQVLACFKKLVNMAGLPGSGMTPATISLTGSVLPGSRSREYSV